MPKLIAVIIMMLLSVGAFSEETESARLEAILKDYAKCADVALGNFPTDQEAQAAIRTFYIAMITDIEKLITSEDLANSPDANFWIEIMGKEMFKGYLLRSFSEVDSKYQDSKEELMETMNHDWKFVHKKLWSDYGCSAIYSKTK